MTDAPQSATHDGSAMKLVCHPTGHAAPEIRPAPLERDWMNATPDRFAYRCLPLNIANGYGWEVLSPATVVATWTGGAEKAAINVASTDPRALLPVSHFGSGVLTFHVPALFRTDPGVDLFVTGPINRPKDGIHALTGIVETDWGAFTFTMNWLFTRPHHPVLFETGEPICHLFPLPRGMIERVEPTIVPLSAEPELAAAHRAWAEGRKTFNAELGIAGSAARQAKWQRDYFQGVGHGETARPAHRTRLKVKPFTLR